MKKILFSGFLLLMVTASHSQVATYNANNQVYKYTYLFSGIERGFQLWVPSNDPSEIVRGLFMNGNPGTSDNSAWILNEQLREYARHHNFGVLATSNVSGSGTYDNYGPRLLDALEAWAALGIHPELRNVPWVVTGNSSAGAFTYGISMLAPERTICFGANVPARMLPEYPSEEALKVPGILIVGENDQTVGNLSRYLGNIMSVNRPRGALWSKLEIQGMGHEHRRTMHIFFPFFEKCIALRLPQDANPRLGPVILNELNEEDGWIAYDSTWISGFTDILPYESVASPRGPNTSWCLDKDMAFLHRAYSSRNVKFQIQTEDTVSWGVPTPENTDLITYNNESDKVIKLIGKTYGDMEWNRIEFYLLSEKIGEMTGGVNEFEFDYHIKHRLNTVCYSFTAIAYDENGDVISPAHMYAVHVFGGNFYSDDDVLPDTPEAPLLNDFKYRSIKNIWIPSTDNDSLLGYHIYLDDVKLNNEPVSDTFYIIEKLQVGSPYSIHLRSRDLAGNFSDESGILTASTDKPESFIYLSDMEYVSAINGIGPIEKDMSNGGMSEGDGSKIIFDKIYYPKGLGVSPYSEIIYSLNREYDFFTAIPGLIEGTTAKFIIVTDEDTVYNETIRKTNSTRSVFIDVRTVNDLKLIVSGSAPDVLWAGAAVMKSNFTDNENPTPPTVLKASTIRDTYLTLNWYVSEDDSYVKEYIIYLNGEAFDTVNTNFKILEGLARGTEYEIKVLAVDINDNKSEFSQAITITTTGNVGIYDYKANGVKIFPNPASDFINLELPVNTGNVNVRILDISGKVLFNNQYKTENITIDTGFLSKGIYIVNVRSGKINTMLKLSVN